MKARPAGQRGRWSEQGILLIPILAFSLCGGGSLWSENRPAIEESASSAAPDPSAQSLPDPLEAWEGLPVRRISVAGVSLDRLAPLPGTLAQAEGKPLNREAIRRSLRQLFATGLFETIAVEAEREGRRRGPALSRHSAHLHRQSQRGRRQAGQRSTRNWSAPASLRPARVSRRPSSIRLWSRCAPRWPRTAFTSRSSPRS